MLTSMMIILIVLIIVIMIVVIIMTRNKTHHHDCSGGYYAFESRYTQTSNNVKISYIPIKMGNSCPSLLSRNAGPTSICKTATWRQ